jgi:uncharacterized repeat protein (TIGR01451 family)
MQPFLRNARAIHSNSKNKKMLNKLWMLLLLSGCASINYSIVAAVAPSRALAGDLEFSAGSYSTPPNGPLTASQTAALLDNTVNAAVSGGTFVTYTPAITVQAAFSNQQYTNGLTFGATVTASPGTTVTPTAVFNKMNTFGSPTSNMFTSTANSTVGTGISVVDNYAFEMFASVQPLFAQSLSPTGRYYYGDLTLTFNQPVSDPVIQMVGFGGTFTNTAAQNHGHSVEFELVNTGITASKLSGSASLNVTANKILNSATAITSSCAPPSGGAACGSVKFAGTNITTLTFKVYVRGDSQPAAAWGASQGHSGDAFLFGGVSVAKPVTVSGTVFDDANALTDSTISGTGTNANGLFANLIDSSNKVVATTAVAANGTYSFPAIGAGQYTVLISTTAGAQGTAAPSPSLPSNWLNIGEGITAAGDGTIDGSTAITVTGVDLTGVNFGIEQRPTAVGTSGASQVNSGALTPVPTSLFTGSTDPDGTVASYKIVTFPSNVSSLEVNGTAYTSATFPVGGVTATTAQLSTVKVFPSVGTVTVGISFQAIDNAGQISSNTATANLPFTAPPDLTVAKSHTGSFTVGSTGTYSMSVNNSGGTATSGTITITDTLPAGLTVNNGAAGSVTLGGANAANWTCSSNAASPQVITCTSSGAIAVSGTSVFSFPVTVGLGTAVGTNSVTNTASVSGGGQINTANDSSSDPTTVLSPNLAISKTHTGNFTQGATGAYSLTVNNTGTAATSGTVTVVDTLPPDLSVTAGAVTLTGANAANWNCNAVGQTITCTSTTAIANGSSSTFGFNVAVASNASASVTNNVSVSGGNEATANNGNNSATDPTIVIAAAPVNLTVTKSTSTPSAVPGGAASYSITIANAAGASTATNVQISDTLPSGFTFDSNLGTPNLNGGATRTSTSDPAQNATSPAWGAFSIPAGGSVTLTFAVNISENDTIGTYQNPVTVTYATGGSASYNSNSSTAEDVTLSNFTPPPPTTVSAPPSTLGGICAIPGNDGPAPDTLSGVVNTYYPATASASAGGTSLTLGTATGSTTAIAKGDLLLVIQMQDATINATNSTSYGSGNASNLGSGQTSMGNSGLYEYVVATNNVPLSGGSLTFKGASAGGLSNSYVNAAATSASGQRKFQVVRVPQYASLKLNNTLSAANWNGSTGGVFVVDVAGDLNFNGRSIDTINRGFRAGYSQKNSSGNSITTYVAPTSTNNNGISGGKGEGTAGTPRFVWNSTTSVDNGSDGYPNGDLGKGAPANAGGAGNAHNAGGGGGGNGGIGGQGGFPWVGAGGVIEAGGRPGFFSSTTAPTPWRLIMGGGGGGGDANNATTGIRGGVGGGLTIIRASRMIGSGTIITTGDDGDTGAFGGAPDGAGGGGAGGTVLLAARSASTANIAVQANGGRGGNTLNDGGNEHGPGGGGGGGVVLYNNVLSSSVTASINGGATGKANGGAGIPHGAVAGSNGQSGAFTNQDDPFASVNSSNCFPQLTVSKITSTPTSIPGGTATYTISVANAAGKSDANGVDITDNLPTGFTYASTSTINLTSGATRTTATNPTAGATAPTWGSFAIPSGGQVQVTFDVNVGSGVASGTYQNPASATYPDPTRAVVNQTATASYDSASSTGEDVSVGAKPNVLLVKRITAVTGSSAIQGGDNVALYKDENGTQSGTFNNPYDDNDITITAPTPAMPADTDKWPNPATFLIGAVNGGNVGPKDEVEYTIYFLSAGQVSASTVTFCDRIPANQTFVPDSYNSLTQATGGNLTNRGIAVSYAGNYQGYTNLSDGDTAQYYAPGSVLPGACGAAANTTGAVVVNLGAGATNALGGTVPSATTSGSPNTSYGFVRFKAKVN